MDHLTAPGGFEDGPALKLYTSPTEPQALAEWLVFRHAEGGENPDVPGCHADLVEVWCAVCSPHPSTGSG
ncbi:MAG: hypothetical protein DRP45_06405 [Candidatus Zixiibacteriota bacterium]|nr:MAG: hypothetical protein DRP45_06405 [candidate division Zixibacteria bacterium]